MRLFQRFHRKGNEEVIERLYARIVDASRQPHLYQTWEVPDTFEGRFDCLTLHASLVLRRLQQGEQPGPEMAQHLTDVIFAHFEGALREMGVGDTSVPKRMKGLAEAFLGRQGAYDRALTCDQAGGRVHNLAAAVARNIYNGENSHAMAFALYVEACADALECTSLQAMIDGLVPFADPASFVGKDLP